jgi:hypothetical protein
MVATLEIHFLTLKYTHCQFCQNYPKKVAKIKLILAKLAFATNYEVWAIGYKLYGYTPYCYKILKLTLKWLGQTYNYTSKTSSMHQITLQIVRVPITFPNLQMDQTTLQMVSKPLNL